MYENCKLSRLSQYEDGRYYITITFPDGHKLRKAHDKYVLEVELNRTLTRADIVIHKDGIISNDDLLNLEIVSLSQYKTDPLFTTKKRCPKCGKDIILYCYDKHIEICDGKEIGFNWDKYRDSVSGLYVCPKCNKEFDSKHLISFHYSYCVEGLHDPRYGQTKENNEVIRKSSETLKKTLKEHPEITETIRQKNIQRFSKDNPNREEEIAKSRKGGLKSSQVRNVRSKNEIHFANLIIQLLGEDKVLLNEPMFDGFDADIIIPDIKLAILWNGAYHYKKLAKSHDPEKAIERDTKKVELIKSFGYNVYEVKDLTSDKPKFVKEQFKLFCEKYYNNMMDNVNEIISNDNTKPTKYKLSGKAKLEHEVAIENRKIKRIQDINYVHKIRTSDIDFSKDGWLGKVAKLLNKNPRFIHRWMREHMPKFYSKCHHRGDPKVKQVSDYEKKMRATIIKNIHLIRTSNIDFSKHGWVSKISRLTGIGRTDVKRWMMKHMPKFYNEYCRKVE